MAEPQPPLPDPIQPSSPPPIATAAAAASSPPPPPKPTSAEDRRAAAALSALDTQHHDPSASTSTSQKPIHPPNKNIDQEALARAISRLELSSSGSGSGGGRQQGGKEETMSAAEKAWLEGRRREKEEREKVGGVKVKGEDVGVLVRELEVGKGKAGEMLRAEGGDVVRAMRAFVRGGGV